MSSKLSLSSKSSTVPDKRGQIVLSAIVSEHLLTGQPVGSKILAQNLANSSGWSSATIRNIMGELEDAGYVEQPHTSAGRIPTDKGYRFYVDNLLGVLTVSDKDLRLINENFGLEGFDKSSIAENLMESTSKLLSNVSENIGIVISPGISQANLQHINFVNLSENRILIVMVYAPNIVHNKVIRIKDSYTQDELDRTARYLNSEFVGKSLTAIRSEILNLMHEEKALFDKMLQTAMIICSQSLEDGEDRKGDVYIDGTSKILTKPDFANFQKLHELLRTIEEKSNLVQILNECLDRDEAHNGDVQVVIGSENTTASLQNCTLITAPYKIGGENAFGTLSVLGPTRIEYPRMIAIVSYIAKILEKTVSTEE